MDRTLRLTADGMDTGSLGTSLGSIQSLLRDSLQAQAQSHPLAQAQAAAPSENVIPFAPPLGEEPEESWADTLTAITHVADTVRATEEQAAQLEARTEKLVGIALEQLSKAETRIVNVELRLEENQSALRAAESRAADLEMRLREAEGRANEAQGRLEASDERARRAEALNRTAEVRAIDAECALELAQERVRTAEARAQDAEQWRERIHDAVATHFPSAVAHWQQTRARASRTVAKARVASV